MTTYQIKIIIPGIPIPWMAHAGYGRRSFNPRYKEKSYTQWHIREQYQGAILEGAVSVCYDFGMPVPKGTSKVKTQKMLEAVIDHTKRPDCTNLTKFYEDCIKEIVFKDDSQVIESIAHKFYSEHPQTLITISPL